MPLRPLSVSRVTLRFRQSLLFNRIPESQRGAWLALISAIGYSVTNLALRDLSGAHGGQGWDIWVSAGKAVPTACLAWILVLKNRAPGQALLPPKQLLLPLIAAALVMQIGGNVGFQTALRFIGLAITVPLVFAGIIISGALLGRTFLGDPVTPRTIVAMLLMTLAIVALSTAATDESTAAAGGEKLTAATDSERIINSVIGVAIAIVSGLSYGVNGVVIRRYVRDKLPVESTLVVFGTTGTILLGTTGFAMLGLHELRTVTGGEWAMILVAGSFNAFAFFCVTYAFKLMSISRVNVINATQNAMCAVGAVVVFSEPLTASMVAGIVLTMLGLAALDRT
ncbi:MAG: DMT family transporter [Planctomycetaceae bacterium]